MIDEVATLARAIAERLRDRGQTVAVADGASGGLISAGLLSVPGASTFYVGGGIIYSLKGRAILLDLDPSDLVGMKSVTEPYAFLQARAIRDRFSTDWGVAETGSAGPGRHPRGRDAGVSCVAVVGPGVAIANTIETHSEDRRANMQAFALAAIGLLNDALSEVANSGAR